MNAVLITTDTMRRDHLGVYGNEWIHTPNLDRLARHSHVFDNAYVASFPTVPNRYDVMTGRFGFTEFDWAPLPLDAVVMSELLSDAGYTTMMIADTPHILKGGYYFDRGFSGWEWIRGQENDRWRTSPAHPELPCAPEKLRSPATVEQHLRNTADRRSEADCFCARTMQAACNWLEQNAGRDFFLYVDTFDPHEPWDAPQWYVDLYDPGYEGEKVTYPRYGEGDYLSQAELKHMRALYAGEVTLVDAWVGRLLTRIEQLGLLDSTAILYTSDHGFYHGEHGLVGKAIVREGRPVHAPLYGELARIPLLIHVPGEEAGKRISAYAQPPDLAPTVLELMGVQIPESVQGVSLLPVMRGQQAQTRPLAISSPSLARDSSPGRWTTVTQGEWALMYPGSPCTPPAAHLPAEGLPEPELYNLETDPEQTRNVFPEHRDVAVSLHAEHVRFLGDLGMDQRWLSQRTELPRSAS